MCQSTSNYEAEQVWAAFDRVLRCSFKRTAAGKLAVDVGQPHPKPAVDELQIRYAIAFSTWPWTPSSLVNKLQLCGNRQSAAGCIVPGLPARQRRRAEGQIRAILKRPAMLDTSRPSCLAILAWRSIPCKRKWVARWCVASHQCIPAQPVAHERGGCSAGLRTAASRRNH